MGSKVVLGKTSLTMLLSVIRVRLIYSPFRFLLRPFQPLETWIYLKLKAPPPLAVGDAVRGPRSAGGGRRTED
jgi:hypothetical protein